MDTSAWGVRVSVSVAELLAGLGSLVPAGGVTVAVLVNGPVALGLIVGVNVKVTLALTGRATGGARAALPLGAAGTLPPPGEARAAPGGPAAPAGSGGEAVGRGDAARPGVLAV